jgi:hypothetical protein
VRIEGSRFRVGLWAGFTANPGIGTERRLIASIRELVDGPIAVPDGPPLDAKGLSSYYGQLANGVEAAYGAVYLQSDADLITVQALKFAPGEQLSRKVNSSDSPAITRVAIGPIVAIVTGQGQCAWLVGK